MNKRPPNKKLLTKKRVADAKPKSGPYLVWDSKQNGLALLVQPTGQKTFKFIYGFGGKSKWFHLATICDKYGRAKSVDLDSDFVNHFRREVRRLWGEVEKGIDPMATKRAHVTQFQGIRTFRELSERYIREYARGKKGIRTWQSSEYDLEKYVLPTLGDRPIAEITRKDVKKLLDNLTAEGKKATANKIKARISSVFKFALDEEVIQSNPVVRIEGNKLKSRSRVLNGISIRERFPSPHDNEFPAFWEAFEKDGSPTARLLQVILLTGQRGGEVSKMRWSNLELDEDGGWWVIPPENLGKDRDEKGHDVFLTPEAVRVIETVRGDSDTWVFCNSRGEPVRDRNKLMRGLCKDLGITEAPVIPHDLRRTHFSVGRSLGLSGDEMDRIHGHADGRVRSVYDRYDCAEEFERNQRTIADAITRLIQSK